ncbi:hypothetical protein DFJ73DRAFT_821913 [Zopfochytrium polystomum]|nr:hypothetical protein DFJ73DRAFT_821913 [Zopfochytrium polystomum]
MVSSLPSPRKASPHVASNNLPRWGWSILACVLVYWSASMVVLWGFAWTDLPPQIIPRARSPSSPPPPPSSAPAGRASSSSSPTAPTLALLESHAPSVLYYACVVAILPPVMLFFVFFSWLGLKLNRHNT